MAYSSNPTRAQIFASLFSQSALQPGAAPVPRRFYLLDAGRALAASAVMIVHYPLFLLPLNSRGSDVDLQSLAVPLAGVLAPLYRHGDIAVPIFWMLSGFVFAHVYLASDASGREFAVNRFARLYPLHFLTLVIVAVLQAISLARFGDFQIVGHNDAYHFLLQLAFASEWGLAEGLSYNGPIWSVSVEIPVYFLYWALHRRLAGRGVLYPLLVVAAAAASARAGLGYAWLMFAWCILFFFAGVAIYIAYRALRERPGLIAAGCALAAALGIAAWAVAPGDAPPRLAILLLFGAAILVLARAEDLVAPEWKRPLGAMGDVSYGLYLWHFPVQLAMILLFAGQSSTLAQSGWFLAGYLLAAAAIAAFAFRYFERPANLRLRALLGARAERAGVPIAAP